MSEVVRCSRCEEEVKPVNLSTLPLIGRFVGNIVVVQRKVTLRSFRQKLSAAGAEVGFSSFHTDVTLCDQCWGAFLSWVVDPGQERAKIAAENRRKDAHLLKVAEQRREAQVQSHLKELEDSE